MYIFYIICIFIIFLPSFFRYTACISSADSSLLAILSFEISLVKKCEMYGLCAIPLPLLLPLPSVPLYAFDRGVNPIYRCGAYILLLCHTFDFGCVCTFLFCAHKMKRLSARFHMLSRSRRLSLSHTSAITKRTQKKERG